jgi:SAM-dependent methyltransferase
MDNVFEAPKGNTSPPSSLRFFIDHIMRNAPRFRPLLDIGCATAGTGAILASVRKDMPYFGFDPNPPLLLRARELHGPDMRLAAGDILNLPFKPGSVPYVLCAGTLWYQDDPAAALEAAYRIASRALLAEIIFTPNDDNGATTTQEINGSKQKVRLLGNTELQGLLQHINSVQPFKDLRQKKRYMHYPIVNEQAGLLELGDTQAQGFLVIFEKRISASLIKIFNSNLPSQQTAPPNENNPASEDDDGENA